MTLLSVFQDAALDLLPPRYQRVEPDPSRVLRVALVALLVVVGIVAILLTLAR